MCVPLSSLFPLLSPNPKLLTHGTHKPQNADPNAACDIPSHLYSFSFDRNAEWTKPYSGQAEIQQYLRNVFDKHNLGAATQFNTALGGATWNEHTLRWDVVLSDGSERHPRFLINAIGGLHHPHVPDVPGVAEGVFEGESFHSAEWDATCDLRGKRVAVVGSAASAVQLVPTVAEQASELVLLQRTPNWVSSRWSPIMPNDRYTEAHKWVFRNVPGAERMHRWALYWMLESLFAAGVWDFEGRAQATAQRVVRAEMHKSLGGDQALIEKVVPTYGVGCKRICRADDYLPALCRDNVLVVPHGLTAVEKDGVVDAQGVKHEVDVIVYATGFKVGSIGSIKIVGRDGRTMEGTSVADEAMEAFLGISCAKFPNSFMLLGPNTALGHNSIIGMIETMATYITRTICEAVEADVDVVEVKQEVIDEYYEWLWPEFDKRVWKHGGCSSWYQNKGALSALRRRCRCRCRCLVPSLRLTNF